MAYYYMPFPFKRLEKIPDNPSATFHESSEEFRSSFFGWVTKGLDKPRKDLERTAALHLAQFQETGEWVQHSSPPIQGEFPPEKRTIGSIKFDNMVGSGQIFDIQAIRKAQRIIDVVRTEANKLLELLIQITHRLYGTEMPWKGWPSLLRVAARGWAMVYDDLIPIQRCLTDNVTG